MLPFGIMAKWMRAVLLVLAIASTVQAETRVWKVHEGSDTDLFWEANRLHGMTVTFRTTGPVDVTTLGHINLKHRCFPGVTAVGYSVHVRYRFSRDLAMLNNAPLIRIPGAISSGNIVNCAQHYADASLESYQFLNQPGWYRYEVWAKSHSTDAWLVDGLLEVNNEGWPNFPVNQFIVKVEDVRLPPQNR